jgi:hypothetical protein
VGGSESAPGYHYVKVREEDPPVTVLATWRATPGRAAELERFIFRFDHVSSLRRWERSEERWHWLQLAKTPASRTPRPTWTW